MPALLHENTSPPYESPVPQQSPRMGSLQASQIALAVLLRTRMTALVKPAAHTWLMLICSQLNCGYLFVALSILDKDRNHFY